MDQSQTTGDRVKENMEFIKDKGLGNTIIIFLTVLAFIINIIMGGGNRFWILLTGGGNLVDYGLAQYDLVFEDLQLWRLVSCGYLHGGIFHLGFNLYALCCIGGIVEKRLGTVQYFLVYHLLMALSVAIWCVLFRDATTVGASSGIFAVIGISLVGNMPGEKKIWSKCQKGKRITYFIIASLEI